MQHHSSKLHDITFNSQLNKYDQTNNIQVQMSFIQKQYCRFVVAK